jgi:hypothetical protein
MPNNKETGNNNSLKALIALAGFAVGATSVVAWNNRKTIQNKILDAKERAFDLKQKTIQLTEASKNKLNELRKIEVNFRTGIKNEEPRQDEIPSEDTNNPSIPSNTNSDSTDKK